jgi:chromate reductase, NAD(P)H dehydrogenase (quinone)
MEHNGLLIAAREYNGSITAALKNTIGWVSRQDGSADLSCYVRKTAGLIATGGGMRGMRGLVRVRQILTNIGVLVIPARIVFSNHLSALHGRYSLGL